jgi:hypothetical protein
MTTITLNRQELRAAAQAGIERRLNAIAKNRPQYYGADTRKNEWQIDIIGSIAEYAVAKHLNVYWEPATNIDNLDSLPGDVAHYQVRSTCWPTGQLIIHQRDRDHAPFILAIVTNNQIRLAGWLYGHEGKTLGEQRDHGDHWIPQNQLHPINTLP